MANHARDNRGIEDKRSALAGGQHRAYSHSDQVGGTRRREADGRWVDRGPEPEPPKPQPLSRQSFGEFVKNNMVYILSAAAVVAIGLLLLFGVRAFSGAPSSSGAGTSGTGSADPENYVSPYDWSKLDTSTNHYAYVVDGKVKSSLGVDVAEYQGDIDWKAVAADGIDFAIIRLGYRGSTEGDIYVDEQYYDNIEGAKAAGLDVGVYFFSQATTPEEAREEANFVLKTLDGTSLVYPVAFDWERVSGIGETRTSGVISTDLSGIADAFCDTIEASGYRSIVYGNPRDLIHYDETVFDGRHIWWAEYDTIEPLHYRDISMWQYTSSGTVEGIPGTVDMNLDLSDVL